MLKYLLAVAVAVSMLAVDARAQDVWQENRYLLGVFSYPKYDWNDYEKYNQYGGIFLGSIRQEGAGTGALFGIGGGVAKRPGIWGYGKRSSGYIEMLPGVLVGDRESFLKIGLCMKIRFLFNPDPDDDLYDVKGLVFLDLGGVTVGTEVGERIGRKWVAGVRF